MTATVAGLGLLLAALGAGGVSALQQPAPASTPDLFIAGHVLDVDAGTPLAHAVVVAAGGGRGRDRGALTDASGRFRIAGLPAGRVTLRVRRPGYLDDSAQVMLAAGQSLDGLDLYVERTGVISGVVTDEHAEPVADITVMAVPPDELAPDQRNRRRVGEYAVTTDERGAYELIVPAGEYVVGVPAVRGAVTPGALEAVGWHDVGLAPAGLRRPMEATTGRTFPWEGLPTRPRTAPGDPSVTYPDTYFPRSSTVVQAARLQVDRGARHDATDIQLLPVTALTLSGVVGPIPAGQEEVHIALHPLDPALNPLPREVTADPQGGFAFTRLPPGRYEVEAFPRRTNDETGAIYIRLAHEFGVVSVDLVDRDVTDLAVTLAMGPTVSARVTAQDARRPSQYVLKLQRLSPGDSWHRSIVTEDGRLIAESVRPGLYEFQAQSGWSIESASRPGQDLLAEPLEVAAGDIDDIDLVVAFRSTSRDGGQIVGTIASVLAGAPVSTALLVEADPEAPSAIPDSEDARTWLAPWSSDDSFELRNIPAGEYWIVAVTPLEAARWREPATRERLAGRAVGVTLAPDERRQVDLMGPGR